MNNNIRKGLDTTQEIWGEPRIDLIQSYGELGEYILESAFGNIYVRPGLSLRDRELCTISMLISQGGADEQLYNHYLGALHVGITQEELLEVVLQSSIYNGMPKAIQAYKTLQKVLEELK